MGHREGFTKKTTPQSGGFPFYAPLKLESKLSLQGIKKPEATLLVFFVAGTGLEPVTFGL
jgi:hypothetical protein